jgi:hypothetical protein
MVHRIVQDKILTAIIRLNKTPKLFLTFKVHKQTKTSPHLSSFDMCSHSLTGATVNIGTIVVMVGNSKAVDLPGMIEKGIRHALGGQDAGVGLNDAPHGPSDEEKGRSVPPPLSAAPIGTPLSSLPHASAVAVLPTAFPPTAVQRIGCCSCSAPNDGGGVVVARQAPVAAQPAPVAAQPALVAARPALIAAQPALIAAPAVVPCRRCH